MEEIKATVEDNIKLSEHKFSSVEEEVKALKGRIDSQQKQLISAFDIMTSIANSSTQNSNSIKVLANTGTLVSFGKFAHALVSLVLLSTRGNSSES